MDIQSWYHLVGPVYLPMRLLAFFCMVEGVGCGIPPPPPVLRREEHIRSVCDNCFYVQSCIRAEFGASVNVVFCSGSGSVLRAVYICYFADRVGMLVLFL